MHPLLRRFLPFLLAGCLAATAQAHLGDTMAELKKQYGSPAPQIRKDDSTATWLFEEGESGNLAYTVTFNAKGQSIAEGLKPIKRARFPEETALTFIELQLAPYRDSKTQQVMKIGEKFRFAGQDFTCGKQEHIVVDEALGYLLIWNKVADPSVVMVSREMLQRGK